jgi:hypothetical protein
LSEFLQNITEISRLGRAGRRTGWLLGRCAQIKCEGKSYRKRWNLFYGINHFPARELVHWHRRMGARKFCRHYFAHFQYSSHCSV